jgi:TrkA domain protein
MPDIEETELPGVGVLHAFLPQCGRRLGVITRRSGRRELVVYDDDDPDAVASAVVLSADESAALAELLGGSRVVERLADVQQDIEGLAIDWLTLHTGSAAAGNTIGQMKVRARTGTSIVAVLRDAEAIPAPGPDFVLMAADSVVVVGTPEGIGATAELLGAA